MVKKQSKKQEKVQVKNWQKYFYYFILCGVIGYIYEYILLTYFYHETFVNQGPLSGPWLMIYAVGGLFIILLLKDFVKKKVFLLEKINITPILTIVSIYGIVGVVEYIGAWVCDVFFNFRPWNYSDKPFNLHGYICIEDSTRFVILSLIGLYLIVPGLEKLFGKMSKKQNLFLFGFLASAFCIDIVYSLFLK